MSSSFRPANPIHLFVARVPSQYIVHGETCCRGEPTVFSETFEFTANGEWHNLKPEDVQPYDTTTALYKEYTAEREKHIVFSPRLRELAAK